ncbi:MAG: CNNM domain-containing protein [Halorhabdus sp.]
MNAEAGFIRQVNEWIEKGYLPDRYTTADIRRIRLTRSLDWHTKLDRDPQFIETLLVATYVPPGIAVVLATLATTVLILVFGEIVPKSYSLGHAETWSLRVSRPIATVEWVLGPLVTLFDAGTRSLTRLLGGDEGIEETYLDD